MRRLPEIDLARIMPLPIEEKRVHLEIQNLGYPPLSYNPTRAALEDIFNVQGELIGVGPVDWKIIEQVVAKDCRNETERRHNLVIAKLLHNHTCENGIWARRKDFFPLKIGLSQGVRFWWNLFFVDEEKAVVPFVDPRLSRGLNREGRRVAFSFMHERVRMPGSDLEDARLAILQFPKNKFGVRELHLHYDDGVELIPHEQLEGMLNETYEAWTAELANRGAQKRSASGSPGGLF
jgi:hypothetical protein